jgi:putative flippase GtrA
LIEWFKRVTRHIPPGQFGRYLLVGVWNTLFGYSVFALFVYLLEPRMSHGYMAAQVISSVINISIAYFGYKFFVFKTTGNYLKEWLKCLAVYGTSSTLPGFVVLPMLVGLLHVGFHLHHKAPYIAGAILTVVGVFVSFFGNRRFTFNSG